MVRTYAYNPSMQCAGNGPLPGTKSSLLPLPACGTSTLFRNANIRTPSREIGSYGKPESGTFGEKEDEKDFQQSIGEKALHYAALTPRPAIDSNCNPNNNSHYSTSNKRINTNNVVALTTTMQSPPLTQMENGSSRPLIVEHATTLLGIRCVLINGQRFYQPIEMTQSTMNRPIEGNVHISSRSRSTGHRNAGHASKTSGVSHLQYSPSVDHLNNNNTSGHYKVASPPEDPGYGYEVSSNNTSASSSSGVSSAASSLLLSASSTLHAESVSTAMIHVTGFFSDDPDSSKRHLPISNRHHHYRSAIELGTTQSHLSQVQSNKLLDNHLKNNKHQGEMPISAVVPSCEDAPWARGNPQPRSGKRGSAGWNIAHATAGASTNYSTGGGYGSFYSSGVGYSSSSGVNLTQFASSADDFQRLQREQHRLELLQQIEENKRRKILEKQREWEMEERERIRNEMYAQRIRLEVEEERRRATEKAVAVERNALRVAAAQRAAETEMAARNTVRRMRSPIKECYDAKKLNDSNDNKGFDFNNNAEAEQSSGGGGNAEWWERRRHWTERHGGSQSPVIPSLCGKVSLQPADDESRPSSRTRRSSSGLAIRGRRAAEDDDDDNAEDSLAGADVRRRWRRKNSTSTTSTSSRLPPRARSHSRTSRRGYQSSIESAEKRPPALCLAAAGAIGLTADAYDSPAIRRLEERAEALNAESERVRNALNANNYNRHLLD